MDRPVDATAAGEVLVRGIDDRVRRDRGDVTPPDFNDATTHATPAFDVTHGSCRGPRRARQRPRDRHHDGGGCRPCRADFAPPREATRGEPCPRSAARWSASLMAKATIASVGFVWPRPVGKTELPATKRFPT